MAHRGSALRALGTTGAVAVLTLASCTAGGGASSQSAPASAASHRASITEIAQQDRVAVPEMSGKDLEGRTESLAAYRGKVVVLNIWGSWNRESREEESDLVRVSKKEKSAGVQFLGQDIGELHLSDARAFERFFAVPYPSVFDPRTVLPIRLPANGITVRSLPDTLIIDRHGNLAVDMVGAVSAEELEEALKPVLAEN